MVGLGETCTHVAAILFHVETLYRIHGSETCTQRKCVWVMPKCRKYMEYLPIKSIDFTSAKSKKRKLDNLIENSSSNSPQIPVKKHLNWLSISLFPVRKKKKAC